MTNIISLSNTPDVGKSPLPPFSNGGARGIFGVPALCKGGPREILRVLRLCKGRTGGIFSVPPLWKRGEGGIFEPGSGVNHGTIPNTNQYDSRGFTIAELMVAIVLTSLIIVVAMAFFIYQTTHGREATKTRASRESLSLAMLMLRQDIMHAGFGVSDKPELAVYMSDKINNAYTRLYINYGTFLEDPHKQRGYIPYIGALAGSTWTAPVQTPPATTPRLYSQTVGPYDVGGLIADNVGSTNRIATLTCSNPGGPAPYTFAVSLGTGMSASDNFAPAISYTLEKDDSVKKYALKRNGKVLLGDDPSDTTASPDRTLRVTGFRVIAMFVGKAKAGTDLTTIRQRWSPGRPQVIDPAEADCLKDNPANQTDPVHDLDQLYPEDLRMLEIMVQYQLRTEEAVKAGVSESGWSSGTCPFYKTIRVSPRTVTLAGY